MREASNIAELVERLTHGVHGGGYRDGLKPAQWSALRYFSNANRFSMTASAFASYQGITAGAASQTIGALVEKRLLKRTDDKADKRRRHLSLTANAKKLIERDPISALVVAALKLTSAERKEVGSGLGQMLAHLISEKRGAEFGYCDACQFLQCTRRVGQADSYRCAQAEQDLSEDELEKICVNFGPGRVDR